MRHQFPGIARSHLAAAPFLAIGMLTAGCASSPEAAADAAASGRRVETVSVGSSQGGSLGFVDIETEASVMDDVIAGAPLAAWSALGDVFETLGLEAPTVDRPSLSMGNERFTVARIEGRSLSEYLECGSNFGRARADQYQVTMQILVQLARNASGGTRVRTTLDAYARPRDVAGNSYHCTSKGTLERRIVELLAQGTDA
jgi:hypothetical protein